jgi:hypothetical protein
VREFGLYTASRYRLARSKNKNLVPSFKKIITHWGLFSKLIETTLRTTLRGQFAVFLRLWEKNGKFPTVLDCKREFINIEEIVSMFGSMSGLKTFLDFCEKWKGQYYEK